MDPVIVRLSPAVARALDALALPGEDRPETVARLVWACGRAKLEQSDPEEEDEP